MSAGMTPTQLSVRHLRREGYRVVEVVEHYNSFTKRRSDLFGMFDILALKGEETLAVQTTSHDNVSSRVRKITEHELIGFVREAGWTVHVHGWKKGANGQSWQLHRCEDLS